MRYPAAAASSRPRSRPAVAAQIVSRAHEDALRRAVLGAKAQEHALRVVDDVAGDVEPLPPLGPLLADVDALYRAIPGTPLARHALGQIEAMKSAITRRNPRRQLRILVMLGERLSPRIVGAEPITDRHPQGGRDGRTRRGRCSPNQPRSPRQHVLSHSIMRTPPILNRLNRILPADPTKSPSGSPVAIIDSPPPAHKDDAFSFALVAKRTAASTVMPRRTTRHGATPILQPSGPSGRIS